MAMDLLGHNFKSTRSCRTDLTSHHCSTDQHQPSWSVLIYRSELHLTMASLGISLLTTETEQLFLWLGAIVFPYDMLEVLVHVSVLCFFPIACRSYFTM